MSEKHFEKLTPISDVKLGIYEDALNFVFEDDDIKNIAISGAYGAGKSSVIESYKYRHGEIKFLNISLANFDEINEINTEDRKGEVAEIKESTLEGKVLNQLMHKIDAVKIPQTNFKVKQKISNGNTIKLTLLSSIYIISAFYMYFYTTWCNYVTGLEGVKLFTILKFTTYRIGLIISGLIISILSSVFIFNLIRFEKNRNIFKKFKFQGNEIEIFEKSEESYFDKYLNEVLYIFDNSNVDVIVFEDMDRYNMNQIFQRLREINNLINSRRSKESSKFFKFAPKFIKLLYSKHIKAKNKPLRFLYLLRDDIFISKDRVKFFDFIIPVVPVVDNSNSYDQFIEHLKKGGVFEKFDEHFLQEISLYVDDMRILKNIYNEFIIYNSKINTTEQDDNKLLAIMVYKNIFPRDFSDTQNNIGFVSTLLNSKEEIIEREIKKIDDKIQKIEEKIESCNKENLKNEDELGILYKIYSHSYNRYIPNTSDPEYIKRKELIDIKNNGEVKDLENEVKELENKKLKLKNKKIKELITRENVYNIFGISYKNFLNEENDFKEIKSSQYFGLIRYLIWNGYIDETYEDYMTYFYPNSLTTNDKRFLRSITEKDAKDWTYKIDNPRLVISRLREIDFFERETLNFSLFDYILANETECKKFLINIIEQLKNKKNFIFMEQYFNSENNLIPYVILINNYWHTFVKEIINGSKFIYNNQKEYILLTLYYSPSEIIDNINVDNILTEAISSDDIFLDIQKPKVEKLIHVFLSIGVKFKSLNYERSHKDLFEAVYQNNLYEFTFKNIALILNSIYRISNENDISHKNYSLFYEEKYSKLYKYVDENIKEYMSLVLDNCKGKIKDNPKAAIELINNENITIQDRLLYIQYLETELEPLKDINESKLWDSLLSKNILKYSEENILYYYFKKGNTLNDQLINFINSNNMHLKFSVDNIDLMFGENSASSLFDSVVLCGTISDDKYKNIIDELKYQYSSFEIEEIPGSKVKILIDLRVIQMTAGNVEFMSENYQSQFIYFIINNIKEYVDNVMDKQPLSYEDLIRILDLDIEDSSKIKLISNTDDTILVINKKYSDDITKYILQHNFEESELCDLIKSYEKQNDSIKEVLKEISLTYIDIIIEENINLPLDIFKYLIEENISTDNKLMLLVYNMDSFSREECEDFIKIIGFKDLAKVFTTGRPRLEVNEINEGILKKFKKRGWISNFQEGENGTYKISRRKLQAL